VVSRAKDDQTDGSWLADLVRTHRDQLPGWQPQSPQVRQLAALVAGRRDLVDQRPAWSNKLTSLLKGYFPEALELIGEHAASGLAVSFLRRWPTLQALQAVGWPVVARFYRQQHCVRGTALVRRREVIAQARPLTADPAILGPAGLRLEAILAQIEPVLIAIERHDQQIATVFAAHPDRALIGSLPGLGPILAPRLLAALGDDRTRFPDARALQCFSGIAPVLIRSGQSTVVSRRCACPSFIRQTFHEHASKSIRHSRWARAYYQQQKDRGKKHHTITRSLAFKWQRILLRRWHDRVPYDDANYLRSLKDRNPTLYQLALTTRLPRDEKSP
jgi:transposase